MKSGDLCDQLSSSGIPSWQLRTVMQIGDSYANRQAVEGSSIAGRFNDTSIEKE